MSNVKHPVQPIVIDKYGVARFKANEIVKYILDNGGIDLNHLARGGFTNEDHEQFAELIGYSVSGWADLSYVSDETYAKARAASDAVYESGEHDVKCMICEERIVDLYKRFSCYSCGKVTHPENCGHRVYIDKYKTNSTCCDDCSVICTGCNKYIYKNEPHNHKDEK